MTVKTRDVNFTDESVTAVILVAKASYGMNLDRADLQGKALDVLDDNIPRRNARLIAYPDLRAGTLTAAITLEGVPLTWPIAFEELLLLPDELVGQWQAAIYELNDSWFPLERDETDRKKAS